jgi:hypothetical protein
MVSVAFMEETRRRDADKKKEMMMDTGMKLEHVLRHLKNAEPSIEHWMEFGDVGRCAEVDGVLANAGALTHDLRHMVDGLVVIVHLLAKQCAALQRRIDQLEGGKPPLERAES